MAADGREMGVGPATQIGSLHPEQSYIHLRNHNVTIKYSTQHLRIF